jgi:hypothetical protein
MASIERTTSSLLQAGTFVQNHASDPFAVDALTTGVPIGVVYEGWEVTDPEGNGLGTFGCRLVYSGGDKLVEVPAPPSYDGKISRYSVGDNGTITVVASGGHGNIAGLSPTLVTWG